MTSGARDQTFNQRQITSYPRWVFLVFGGIFLLSGGTSLVYQLIWMRQLSLFFGSDIFAAAITLSVFMGGLSLGGYAAGRIGDSIRSPLLAYGILEIGIAVYAFLFSSILFGLEDPLRSVYQTSFTTDPIIYQGFRVAVAAGTLLAPTFMMGATLPLFVRQFARREDELGRSVGYFYSVNTLGALMGTLIAGFVLLPLLGVAGSTIAALSLNLALGIAALGLALSGAIDKGAEPSSGADNRDAEKTSAPIGPDQVIVALAIFISGLAALALEVVWTRILVQSFSGTVYAFAIMLSVFLFGIYYGSRLVSATVDQNRNPIALLYRLEIWLAGTVALLPLLTFFAPGIFGQLTWNLTGILAGNFAIASVIAQFLVASVLILVPTTLLGATFPVAAKAYTGDIRRRAHGTGVVYAANTAGAVFGALLGGFVLLPFLGSRASLIFIALLFMLTALLLRSRAHSDTEGRPSRVQTALPAVLLVIGVISIGLLPRQIVTNFNLQSSTTPDVIYHGEGVSHTVDLVRSDAGHTIMMVNGNIEADTTLIQRRHFILKAHLPVLLHQRAKDVAIVGLGLGITAEAIVRNPIVDSTRLIELSPEMVSAHRLNPEITKGVLDDAKLSLLIDDGRNFMSMTNERFDIITADPIHPRVTGVGYLYTREYYESIKQRLKPGGIVLQWMPMYQISKQSFDVAFRTFAEVFPEASFWYVRGHGLFVAGLEPLKIDHALLSGRFALPKIRDDLASIGIDTPEDLLGHLLMDSDHIRGYLESTNDDQINTDDNAYLEYRTPFEFLGRTKDIVSALKPHAGWNADETIATASGEARAKIMQSYQHRLDRLLPELDEPIE